MHVADGILPVSACAAAGAVSLSGVYFFGRNIPQNEIAKMGVLAAALFTASLIHIPLAGTSLHFGLLGLAGIVLGGRAVPTLFSMLLLQALLFQHGGLLSVGINTVNMSLGALAGGWIWRSGVLPGRISGAVAGFVATMIAALAMAAEFWLAGYGKGFFWIAGVYSLLAVVEGALTAVIIESLRRAMPEVLA